MAISFVKSLSTSIKSSSHHNDGYQNKITEPDTVSDNEDDDQSNQREPCPDADLITSHLSSYKSSYKPEHGGPFSLLNPSIWPQDIITTLSQPEDSHPPYHFDEYGFIVEKQVKSDDKTDEQSNKNLLELACQNELKSKWISYLEFNYNDLALSKMRWSQVEIQMKHSKALDELISVQVPNQMRPQIWMRLSKGLTLKTNSHWTYAQLCDLSNHVPTLSDKQIMKILPNNSCFMNSTSVGVERLRRILRIIKWLQKTGTSVFNMVQESINLPLIAAYLLLVCEEEEAFWLALLISNEMKSFDHQEVLKCCLTSHCKEIDELLKQHDIELSLITSHWFLSCFAGFIPDTKVLFHFWDLYFYYGPIVLFQLTIGLFSGCTERVSQIPDSAALFNVLSDLLSQINNNELLMSNWSVGSQLIQYLATVPVNKPINLSSSISMSSIPSSNDSCELNDLKTKNVRQTSILVELHDSIIAIARHFEAHDSIVKANLTPNYFWDENDEDEVNEMNLQLRNKRAKALIDFQRHDPDELGFRKNDIITIVNEKDEHCWVGELNGHRGWFPAKFVEVLDERNHDYSIAGDDRVTPFINDLVRGRFYRAFKSILSYGMKKTIFIHTHPWTIIEAIVNACIDNDFNSVYSRLVLTRTFRLDEYARVLTPSETLYRSIAHVNQTHENEAMDVKLRSLLCIALNQQILHHWFGVICTEQPQVVSKWYYNWSYLNSPAWRMIRAELKLLTQFSFNLNSEAELPDSIQPKSPVSKDGVRDMLVKHHLFSWDI